MLRTTFLTLFCGLACLVAASWTKAVSASNSERQLGNYQPKVGEPHPDFTLPRIDNGAPVSLRDFRGKKVLLIHFASW